jgi:hypothetical protein
MEDNMEDCDMRDRYVEELRELRNRDEGFDRRITQIIEAISQRSRGVINPNENAMGSAFDRAVEKLNERWNRDALAEVICAVLLLETSLGTGKFILPHYFDMTGEKAKSDAPFQFLREELKKKAASSYIRPFSHRVKEPLIPDDC